MTALFFDSFDHYGNTFTSDFRNKWTSSGYGGGLPQITTSYGRRGTSGIYWSGSGTNVAWWYKSGLPQRSTFVFGFAYYLTSILSTAFFVGGRYAATDQIGIQLNSDRSVSAMRGGWGGTAIETSAVNVVPLGKWCFIEMKATIDNSAGAYEIRVDGVDVVSGTGADTQQHASVSTAGTIYVYHRYSTMKMDDFYWLDTNGSIANDFLGDIRVDPRYPDGAGASTDWTPSAGANYQCVDETQPNDDTDYVSETTAGDHDTYTFDDLDSTSGSVFGVQQLIYARKDDAGSRSLKTVCRSGTTDYHNSNTHIMSDTYDYYMDILEEDPDTSSQWTISGVNSAEFGQELES
jgi:hypothetical protein